MTTYHRDFLCNSYYPSEFPPTPAFQLDFVKLSGYRYTRYTQQYFKEVAYSITIADLENTISNLMFSIRYTGMKSYTKLVKLPLPQNLKI
jgi:hypothetical protein